MEQSANGVGTAAMTGARAVMDLVIDDQADEGSEGGVWTVSRSDSQEMAREQSPAPGARSRLLGSGVQREAELVEDLARHVARAAGQGVEGIGAVARTGAWAVREGAEILLPNPFEEKNTIEGGVLSYEYTEAQGGGERRDEGGDEGGEPEEAEAQLAVEPGRRLEKEVDTDRDMLLVALKTAEVMTLEGWSVGFAPGLSCCNRQEEVCVLWDLASSIGVSWFTKASRCVEGTGWLKFRLAWIDAVSCGQRKGGGGFFCDIGLMVSQGEVAEGRTKQGILRGMFGGTVDAPH